MCGGELEMLPDRDMGNSMQLHSIHDAVQFQLDLFHFYRLAREKATKPEQCLVLEYLYEVALDHLFELEEKYHAHLDQEMVDLAKDEEKLMTDWACRGVVIREELGVADLYRGALEMERRARDHFRSMANEFPTGLENELSRELAAEQDEHISMLETELEQVA
jgi:hypothetical protein